ncbi:MAG: VVA0879 family protein [Oscillospiraceae bacterium]|nr:VVA0879 family protein [Oscillospiraceae bacterium]
MAKQTLAEWRTEAIRRFGKDPASWAFQCPACGKVSTVRDFVTLGKGPNEATQNCIGRYNGHMRPASQAGDGQGCDWAAYGLFGSCGKGRIVIAEDDTEVEVFDFAPGDGVPC